MASAGFLCLAAALAISLYGIGASLYGAHTGRREFVDSGRRAVYALAGMLIVAMLILALAFVRSDFSFALVASHSSTTTPAFYRATAVWSSQEGSLLLWLLLLSLWSSLILYLTRRRLREIVIDVKKQGAVFEGQADSLVTKCPSKFTAEPKT